MLIGTAVGFAAGQALLGFPPLPSVPGGNSLLLAMIGVFVGARITRSALSAGARSLLPAALLAGILLLAGTLVALFVSRLGLVDLRTALFAAAPGGITEMSTVGASLGADGAAIASIHLVRVLLTILAVSAVFSLVIGDRPSGVGNEPQSSAEDRGSSGSARSALPGLTGGIVGGVLGSFSPLPAGALIGALVGSAAVALWRNLSASLPGLRVVVQALGGVAIGSRVGPGFLSGLAGLAAAGAVIIGAQMLLWALTYLMLRRLFDYSPATALFASAPGGMSEVVASAADTGADLTVVAFGHLVRLTAVIVVIPYIVLSLS